MRAFYMGASEAARLGLVEKAREWSARAVELDPHEHGTHYNVACVLARLGDAEEALDLLEELADAGFGHRPYEPIDYSGIDREALLESARHPYGSCRPTTS